MANLGSIHKFNSPESGEICSIVTACGIEGNYTIGNRVPGTGWLAYAKETCLGKNVIDLLPVLSARYGAAQPAVFSRQFRRAASAIPTA